MRRDRVNVKRLSFGEVLAIFRIKRRLTPWELSELVGWPVTRIDALERNDETAPPTKAEAEDLAKALDIKSDLLTVAVPK